MDKANHSKSKPYRNGKQAVKAVKTYVQKNYARAFTLDDLADLTGFNKHYLRTLFKNHVGLSPHAYQQQLRLDYAKQLLEQGISAAEAASQVGFADQSHLNRHFKKHLDMTVGEYQRHNLTSVETEERI